MRNRAHTDRPVMWWDAGDDPLHGLSISAGRKVDVLLSTGTSIRAVSRLSGCSRSAVARHAQHIAPTSKRFGLIRGTDGSGGPPDPLVEALGLAERAKTQRQRLQALEAVRRATRLMLRGVAEPDAEMRLLLDRNVDEAARAYRSAETFDVQTRALGGLRSALFERLEASRSAEAIETALVVSISDGEPMGEPVPVTLSPTHYWAHVPERFRNEKYAVDRTISLVFGPGPPGETIKVREVATGAIAWAHETPKRRPGWKEET